MEKSIEGEITQGTKGASGLALSVDKIEMAKQFAFKKFAEVGKTNHFPDVLQILHDEFLVKDQNVLIASILHDTLEDTYATYKEITDLFSKEIANLVQEVSHPKNYTKEQKAEYYERIKTISSGAKFIKMADFASHLRNFVKIYEKGEQHLHPKFVNNDKYVASIREFLNSCEESDSKQIVNKLTNKLEALI